MSENELQCDECGQFGAREIASRALCDECINLAGCGCAGRDCGDEN